MDDAASPPTAAEAPPRRGWLAPALRVAFVLGAALAAWQIAEHWNRWTGAARFASTDDATMAGDFTPLAAKVPGYVARVAVGDYQAVRRGDLLVEIEDSDYRAQLAQAEANLAAAEAGLDSLANQRAVQAALVRQAEATIQATAVRGRASLVQFVIGRIVTGVGNGVNTSTIPTYQAECELGGKSRGLLICIE